MTIWLAHQKLDWSELTNTVDQARNSGQSIKPIKE